MKKTKFMIGALVLSMGLLGTGYAYWTDTLAVSTQVSTGKFDVTFVDAKSEDRYDYDRKHAVDSKYTTFVTTPTLEEGPKEGDRFNQNDKIKIDIKELVPGSYTTVNAKMINNGTVAARLTNVIPKLPVGIDSELAKVMDVEIKVKDGEMCHNIYKGTLKNLNTGVNLDIFGRDILFVPNSGADSDIELEVFVGLSRNAGNVHQVKTGAIELEFLFEQAFDKNFSN